MKIRKRINSSKRGLTFSFNGFGKFMPGKKYRYILDKKNNRLMILPVKEDENGLKISRKKVKNKEKSLFDIRNREIRDTMAWAEYLEIEISENSILVSVCVKKCINAKDTVISIDEYMERIASFHVPMEATKAAGYGSGYHQFSLDEIFGIMSNTIPGGLSAQKEVKSDLPKVLKIISLFSGAGMMDYPFAKDKDFQIVYAAECDADAVNTYKKNIGSHIRQMDVCDIKGSELPSADIIIGGPPCQPYSRANPSQDKRGHAHEKGDLLKEYVRIVKETKIKVFVIENVPQFMTDSYGENMDFIKSELSDYELTAKIVVDSDVGGYTNRKRTFIVGSKLGSVEIPDLVIRPVHTVGQAIKKVHKGWKNYLDVSKPKEATKKRISLIPEGGNWKDLPKELQTRGIHSNMYRRLDRNKPGITICNWRKYILSPPRYDNSGYWDRILSVAEAAALSGLDESFSFYGKLSSMQQQVGNGVPYAMAKFIKGIIKKVFFKDKKQPVYAMS